VFCRVYTCALLCLLDPFISVCLPPSIALRAYWHIHAQMYVCTREHGSIVHICHDAQSMDGKCLYFFLHLPKLDTFSHHTGPCGSRPCRWRCPRATEIPATRSFLTMRPRTGMRYIRLSAIQGCPSDKSECNLFFLYCCVAESLALVRRLPATERGARFTSLFIYRNEGAAGTRLADGRTTTHVQRL
jgi:hypothetical protein